MPCATPCKNCDRKGLPIFFTRYAAAYSVQSAGMAALKKMQPTGKLQAKPNGVAMNTALYNVRMLRPGYLYVRIKRTGMSREWTGYAVHPHGYLMEFAVASPQDAKPQPACEVEIRGANASMVWVGDAERVETLHYMFHPDTIDYEHLRSEIEPNLGKYMQSFDVAAWAKGSTSQKDTTQPGQLNGQVVEFAALSDAKLRDAMEPQMFGLMGANAQERGWGDYEVTEDQPQYTAGFDAMPVATDTISVTRIQKGLPYATAHGPRLKKIAEFLQANKGSVAVCEDAMGISQELGHLQAEAQTLYAQWQLSSSPGFESSVTNEWVYQSALGAQSLRDLVKKGAIEKTDARITNWNESRRPAPTIFSDETTREHELARRRESIARNQRAERDGATQTGDAQYRQLFDNVAAANIIEAQRITFEQLTTLLAHLGEDHVAWLRAQRLDNTMACYSPKDDKIDRVGGGFMLTLQLAQSLSGTASNAVGRSYLKELDLWGSNLFAQMLCFRSATHQAALKDMYGHVASASAPPLPGAEAYTAWADNLVDHVLKPYAGRFALGDKALAFGETMPTIGESAKLRKLAWPLHIASLMSVKMMQTVNGLPATKAEAAVVRFVALTGVATMGKTAATYAQSLSQADRDRLRNVQRKFGQAAAAGSQASAMRAVPNARAAAIAGIFDVGGALLKGYQLSAKRDGRTAVEMVGSLLQGTGSIMDWRAKAYEETIFKGVAGTDLFSAKGQALVMDNVNALKLKGMRLTAFKFLLPAAFISAFLDATDALKSGRRGQFELRSAQWTSVVGSAFTITAAGMAATGALFGVSAGVWAAATATLGLIGAALTLVAVIAIWILKEDDWQTWLRDNPLNNERKGQKPIHDNLKDTLQKLSNAMASA